MKTYIVTGKISGYHNMRIKAESENDAIRKANLIIQESDYGRLEDVDWELNDVYEDKN